MRCAPLCAFRSCRRCRAIIARLRRVFDLGADPVAIAAHLAQDPVLAPLVKARPGLRVPGAWDGFELAIRAVLGQQITVVAARGLAGKLVAAYGKKLRQPEAALTHVFPEPKALAKADLATLGMPRSRAATLSAVAKDAIAHPQLFEATGESRRRNRAAASITRRRRMDGAIHRLAPIARAGCFPGQRYRSDARHREARRPFLSAAELLGRADPWRPWRAYAAQHLWSAA